jgi:DNA repair exonuclease SbcCD ATPase subunit
MDARYYYGVGNAVVEEEEWSAWEEARDQALETIAHQVQARIYSMQEDYNSITGDQTANFFISMNYHITQVILCDTKPSQRTRIGRTCYVLLASPRDKARAIITESLDHEKQKNDPSFSKGTALSIMDKWLKTDAIEQKTPKEEQIAILEDTIKTLEEQIAALQDTIKTLEERLASSMTDRADIQKRLDEARSEISHLHDIIVEQTNEIKDILYRLTVREQDFEQYDTINTKQKQQIAALQDTIKTLEERLAVP